MTGSLLRTFTEYRQRGLGVVSVCPRSRSWLASLITAIPSPDHETLWPDDAYFLSLTARSTGSDDFRGYGFLPLRAEGSAPPGDRAFADKPHGDSNECMALTASLCHAFAKPGAEDMANFLKPLN
jgi:hypothetical protein